MIGEGGDVGEPHGLALLRGGGEDPGPFRGGELQRRPRKLALHLEPGADPSVPPPLEHGADVGPARAGVRLGIAAAARAQHRGQSGVPLRGERAAARLEQLQDRGADPLTPMLGMHGTAELDAGAAVAVWMRGDGYQSEADYLLAGSHGDGVLGEVQARHLQPFADARLLDGFSELVVDVDRVQQRGERGDVLEGQRAAVDGRRRPRGAGRRVGSGTGHGVPPGSR